MPGLGAITAVANVELAVFAQPAPPDAETVTLPVVPVAVTVAVTVLESAGENV